MEENKAAEIDAEHVDDVAKQQPQLMKSGLDHLSPWKAIFVYKRVTLVCLLAAFSASLDGYRELASFWLR